MKVIVLIAFIGILIFVHELGHFLAAKYFNVKVVKVNTLNRSGKRKRNRRSNTFGQRPNTKRAIVTLAGDERIELFES